MQEVRTLRQSPLLVARPVSTTTSGGCSRRKVAPHERRGEEGSGGEWREEEGRGGEQRGAEGRGGAEGPESLATGLKRQ